MNTYMHTTLSDARQALMATGMYQYYIDEDGQEWTVMPLGIRQRGHVEQRQNNAAVHNGVCRDCGAPGLLDDRGYGVSCGCAGEH